MNKYVTLDKMSKKQKHEFNSMRRGTWGDFNPVTRKVKNGKAYDRNKLKREDSRAIFE